VWAGATFTSSIWRSSASPIPNLEVLMKENALRTRSAPNEASYRDSTTSHNAIGDCAQ
jgi:hypothetical protein